MINSFATYGAFFKVAFKQGIQNRAMISGTVFFLFVLLFVYNRLWEVIGLENNQSGLNATYIWYLLLAEMIIISSPRPERIITDDVQSGTMAYYINKPISFFLMRYIESIGAMTVSFVVMGLSGSILTLLLTGEPPFSWSQFPFIILMCYLSSCINVLFFCGIGLSALWLESTRTISMALERLAFIFGGAIFPLSIYPDWFVDIAKWTPFYAVYYNTIRLVYTFSWPALAEALTLNILWTILIVGFVSFAYHKLNKKVNVYGG